MKRTFYVTTPIYYVNDVPHIGHAYTTVAADCVARFRRLRGDNNVLFSTGTDEHGQKVEKAATAAGLEPQAFVDGVVERFRSLWTELDISNDSFVRTTSAGHKKAAEHIWRTIAKSGDIYLGEYEDWYCTPCESFFTDKQLVDGKCPDCSRPVEKLKEASYFFKLSKYGDKLLEHYEKNPGFIRPESRRNEIISFVKEGLRDLSVSRTTFSWGIPVPDDPAHVMYVWFDALTNYLTATGFPEENRDGFWPADLHIIGKDILRFHAVYWPAFLIAAGLPLPKSVFAHGWWTVDGQKMSKSKGNVVDPGAVVKKYGVDAFRYFLLREVPFGLDGDYSEQALVRRINGDLANSLGNLVSRAVTMIVKYRQGVVPQPVQGKDRDDLEGSVKGVFAELRGTYPGFMEELRFGGALASLWGVIAKLNEYVDKAAPWAEKDEETLSNVLYTLAEGLRLVSVYIYPFMPNCASKVRSAIGLDDKVLLTVFETAVVWGGFEPGARVERIAPIFPRIQ